MLETLISYVDKFGPEVLVILFGMLVILSTLFLWLWFANRRKYHNLKHAIPANVVKNYLDSIIQNSTALKSSLFRGGGLDMEGIPSVMPLGQLTGGEGVAVSGAPSTALLEELNQKKAQLASLEAQHSSLQAAHRELEGKHLETQTSLHTAQERIIELEGLLAQKGDAPEGVSESNAEAEEALKTELLAMTKERDEVRDRLREFEIIADDLANLKRLQQENEQLKRSLEAQGGTQLPADEAAPVEEATSEKMQNDVAELFEDLGNNETGDTSALEDFLSSPEPVAAESTEAPESVELSPENQKTEEKSEESKDRTPEDLLSEFEKMLG